MNLGKTFFFGFFDIELFVVDYVSIFFIYLSIVFYMLIEYSSKPLQEKLLQL